jgi:mRNA interferase YafQ
MRTIERSSTFKRDFKRAKSAARSKDLDSLLTIAVTRLASDEALPVKNRDHALSGNWMGYRECHLKPDLLLIYSKPDAVTLRLVRLGSHSDLFG